MSLIIGFSSGCLFKLDPSITNKNLEILLNTGCNAVELCLYELKYLPQVKSLDKGLLSSFDYVSIHAPVRTKYSNDEQTIEVLDLLKDYVSHTSASNLLFHPDTILDWEVFKNYQDLPLAIENMDSLRTVYINPEEFKKHITEDGFGFVADLQHLYSFSPLMELEKGFLEYHPITQQVHFSGHAQNGYHIPIHTSVQLEILNSLKNWQDKPIIIEGVVDNFNELKEELNYIKNHLKTQ